MRIFFIPNRRFWQVLFIVLVLALIAAPVAAQGDVVAPVAATGFDLSETLAGLITYALYVLALSGVVQVAVNSLKPLVLDRVKANKSVTEDGYLVVLYALRTTLTIAGYLGMWGGVAATRAVAPFLGFIPDVGVGLGTIALVVLGEEVIHPLLDYLYALRDAARLLGEPPPEPESGVG